ncbi:hypothetical protein GOQ29_01940 [Clostridium sp. D2Q-14]|uniref:formyltransferase family protein n=1 Tax=Anaeromonas gelatinilytica TaxID=2683194 RepID=UPI00193BF485|nr:formyltransferase family protein [Anaeromonas gelatinilytica]MBS4534374.1 hypothetical protein [Anaeromonas gelatinilytica]
MTKRIVLFGTIPTARRCLEILHTSKEVELVGVVTDLGYVSDEETVSEYAIKNNIPVISMDECMELEVDLGFTIRFHKIIKQPLIDHFKEGIINMHGGPLPSYRGSFCNVMAMLNREEKFGVTLHYIDADVDTGDVIDISYFDVTEDDTGYSIFLNTLEYGVELFRKTLPSIIEGINNRIKQNSITNQMFKGMFYTRRSDLEKFKQVDIKEMSNDEIITRVKAFYFPGKESIYTVINGKKIYLTL